MTATEKKRLHTLCQALHKLSEEQIRWVETVVAQFQREADFRCYDDSTIFDKCFIRDFGDALRIHHCFSSEPFIKDKFEYALVRILNLCGQAAELAPRGNPGHDASIGEQRFSLKTQADRQIKGDKLHISKFMELGKGQWGDREADLTGLRERFFAHMQAYDRILSLRLLQRQPPGWHYELVEVPKVLLLEAAHGELVMRHDSRQFPKPGYCTVRDEGGVKFQLYFDGGTERKLQIKHLDKRWCKVWAEWLFTTG